MNMNDLSNQITQFCKKNAVKILAGVGIVGTIGTAVVTAIEAPKAAKAIEEKEKEKGEKLTFIEKVQTVWKYYIPTAVTVTATGAAIIGAAVVSDKREAALATMYATATRINNSVQKSIHEHSDEEREEQKQIEHENVDALTTGSDTYLCADVMFGGDVFVSSKNDIIAAVNYVNKLATTDGDDIPLSTFLSLLGRNYFKGSEYIIVATPDHLMDITFGTDELNDKPVLTFRYPFRPARELTYYSECN